ncbi:MAG: DUF3007 family protein [Pseudanabaenaceae cyanobacterium]
MRRIDAILLALLFFGVGGLSYWSLRGLGLQDITAGIWSQLVLVAALLTWLASYGVRAFTKTMTLDRQIEAYKTAYWQRQWEKLSPEERAQILAETQAERPQDPK